jgi:hypothetical protein
MAQIYFGIENLTVPVGDTFEVGVFLDSHSQSVAVVESLLTFTDGLRLVDIRDGNSVINLWLDRPHSSDTAVAFSGLVPGGYTGDRGELFTLVFQAQKIGEMRIESPQTSILLNDGKGTPAEVVPAPIGVTVVSEGETAAYTEPTDTDPPEDFTPLLIDPGQFGYWALAFATQDKGSGIDHYEVKEGWFGWQEATSPYTLAGQKLRGPIYVRAIDRAGNERLAKLPAAEPLLGGSGYLFWGILGLVLVVTVAIVATRKLWGKASKKRKRK